VEIEYSKGIHVKGIDLWLDAEGVVDFSFISHAHIDHVARHKKILATPQTARLYEKRLGKTETKILKFNEPYRLKGARVELFPSGHILGSAQIMIEKRGVKLVYTGDFKLRRGWTAEKAEIRKCDILIMESTFGLPRYVFPSRQEVEKQIIDFVEETFAQNRTPVILAYTLGKAQEAMKLLGNKGFKLSVHGSICKLASVYEEFGIKFKNYVPYRAENVSGRVLIAPPWTKNSRMILNIRRKRTAVLTGWAMDGRARNWYGADKLFPLSDHADFSELLEYVKKANPAKIYTVHGFTGFADHLREQGFDAQELKKTGKSFKFSKELLLNHDLFRML
jgi:Cft2 family RNA processing exonuclease